MKKAISIILAIIMFTACFVIIPVEVNAGTNPEPMWILPSDDAEIRQWDPDINFNYGIYEGIGAPAELEIRHHATKARIIYMKFDISSINISEMNTAIIRIYAKNPNRVNKDQVDVYGMEDSDWTETTVTWSNAPQDFDDPSKATFIASFVVDENKQKNFYRYYNIDIKNYIIDQYNKGKTDITLAFKANDVDYTLIIQSKDLIDGFNDGPNPPYLIINQDQIPPSAPQNLEAVADSSNEIKLTWDHATDNVAVAGYEIYKNDVLAVTVGSEVNSYTFGELTPLTEYSFYLKAVDSSQNISEKSETVTGIIDNISDDEPPTVPQNLSGEALTLSRVMLSWEPSEDNIGIAGYIVYCGDSEIATVGSDVTSYVVEGLSSGTSYTFSIKAFDFQDNRSGKSDEITVSTPGLLHEFFKTDG